MFIIVSSDINTQALKKLEKIGEVYLFETRNIVYPAISNHPDIFMAQLPQLIIIAPLLVNDLAPQLQKHKLNFIIGNTTPGRQFPQTVPYNICVTDTFLFHNFRYTDDAILLAAKGLQRIHVEQGYTRCNLIALGGKGFLTSDKGIARVLQGLNQKYFYINPKNILLPGFAEGFIGGACGYYHDTLFVHGSLQYLPEYESFIRFLEEIQVRYCDLCNKPLMDIGSLFFC